MAVGQDMRHWKTIAIAATAVALSVGGVAAYLGTSSQTAHARIENGVPTNPNALRPPALEGIDLARLTIEQDQVTAPAAASRTAILSLDPELQRTVKRLLVYRGVTEGSVIVMDLRSGRLLVYASVNEGAHRDINVEATAPAASVFKVVTATALVSQGISIDHKECYRGGQSGFSMSDLIFDEQRDKWCATLAGAVGRSLNIIMGRLAKDHLTPQILGATAKAYGFGAPIAFDVPVAPSQLTLSEDDELEFARTAAGFWNTTLSPMHALTIAQIVAKNGVAIRPVIVNSIVNERGKVLYRAPAAPQVIRRVMQPELAEAVGKTMQETFKNGTAHGDFYDRKGRAFLPNVQLAGKTGSLTNSKQRYFTWLVGYAGLKEPDVAYAVMVNNGPKWRTKAPLLTREVLRAYYASQGAQGITEPPVNAR